MSWNENVLNVLGNWCVVCIRQRSRSRIWANKIEFNTPAGACRCLRGWRKTLTMYYICVYIFLFRLFPRCMHCIRCENAHACRGNSLRFILYFIGIWYLIFLTMQFVHTIRRYTSEYCNVLCTARALINALKKICGIFSAIFYSNWNTHKLVFALFCCFLCVYGLWISVNVCARFIVQTCVVKRFRCLCINLSMR